MAKFPKANNRKFPVSEFGIALILLGIGIIFNKFVPFSDYFPFNAIFHWSTLLIIIGLIRGYNVKFTGMDWLIMIIIGVVVWIKKIIGFSIVSPPVIIAAILIIVGSQLIFSQRRKAKEFQQMNQPVDDTPILPFEEVKEQSYGNPYISENIQQQDNSGSTNFNFNDHKYTKFKKSDFDPQDYVTMESFFGSNSKMVISKNLKGGNVSTIFGSGTLLLNKADIEGTIFLDVFCMFGELTIIVPAEFTIINNVTSILGELSDKRNFLSETNSQKTLIIRGQVIAGSIRLKNF